MSGQVDAEKIVGNIINSCEDDYNDFYFDKYGKSLENTTTKTAPLERARKPAAACAEFIMSIEEFAGTTQDKVFVPSQEESDLNIEEQVPGESQPILRMHDSDAEEGITEIPEEYNIKLRPKGDKYSKHFLNPAKFVGIAEEMVEQVPWVQDGIHHYKILCEHDEWIDRQKDGHWYDMNSTK